MKLTHVRLLVRDFPRCFRFYRDVLGFPVEWGEEQGHYADFRAGDALLALFDAGEMAEAIGVIATGTRGQDRAVLIFQVVSVDQAFQELSAQGVDFLTRPTDQPSWGIRVAHLRDPEGNLLELYHPL